MEEKKQTKEPEEPINNLVQLACGRCDACRLEIIGIMYGEVLLLRCECCGILQEYSLLSKVIKLR